MKVKIEKAAKIVILILIMTFIISLLLSGKSNATVVSGSNKFEVFETDLGNLNWHEIPVKELSSYLLSVWCSEHDSDVDGYMTAPQALHDAYYANSYGKSKYSSSNPYKYYTNRPGKEYGLVPDHESQFIAFERLLNRKSYHSRHADAGEYEGDDQDLIDNLRASLPGIGTDILKSIEFTRTEEMDATGKPGAAYVFTASPVYDNPSSLPMNKGGEGLSAEQKELGYFTTDEKQAALWKTDLGINIGNPNNWNDRNLGEIAFQYQSFYQALKSNPNGYQDFVQAYPVDEHGNVMGYQGGTNLSTNGPVDYPGQNPSSNGVVDYPGQNEDKREYSNYIRETTTELGGQNYKTYQYKDTYVEIDPKNECYVLRTILY